MVSLYPPIDCSIFDKPNSEPENFYADMLIRNAGTIENAVSSEKTSVTAILNRIPLYFLPSKMLCKLEYFFYLHTKNNFSLKDNDIKNCIDELEKLQKEILKLREI